MDTPKNNIEDKFDVTEWIELHKKSPDDFDKKRDELIQRTINNAPEHLRHRLKGLQFQIDGIRKTSSNPMSACIKISKQMFNKLNDLKEVVEGNASKHLKQTKKADILEFNPITESE